MSMFSKYVREREGNQVLEVEGQGFVEFRALDKILIIEGIFVEQDLRLAGVGRKMLDSIVESHPECTLLWARIGTHYLNATESLAACIAYGFKVYGIDATFILMKKDIGGSNNGQG